MDNKVLVIFIVLFFTPACTSVLVKRDCSIVKCKREEHDIRYWRN